MNFESLLYLVGIFGLLTFDLVVVVEAIVIKSFGGYWGKSFLEAFVLNLVSTGVGLVLYPVVILMVVKPLVVMLQVETTVWSLLLQGLLVVLGFIVSLWIEFSVLVTIRREDERRKLMRIVIIANTCSCILVMILLGWVFYLLGRKFLFF